MAATVERRWRPDGQPTTARPVLPSPDIPHLNRGQSHRSRIDIPPLAVGWLWPAQVPHARPSAATPWSPGSAAGGRLTVLAASVSVLVQSSLSWFSCTSSPSLWKYRSTTSHTSSGSILKFLGTIDVLMSPLGCRNPWPLVGKSEAY